MQMNSPLINIPILLHKDSAYWIECVVKMIDRFELDEDEIKFHMYLLEIASTPDEGSSRNNKEGLPINEIHTQSFLLFPPLKVPALWFLNSKSCKWTR